MPYPFRKRLNSKHVGKTLTQEGVKNRGRVEDTRFEAKNSPSRGQGQECSRPRPKTQAQVFSKKSSKISFRRSPNKKQKRSSKNLFRRSLKENKKGLREFSERFLAFSNKILIVQIVLSLSRGQANFRGLETSKPRT